MDDIRSHTGTLIADIRLSGSITLKDRRRELRPLLQKLLQNDLAVSQIGPSDLTARVFLAIATVSGTPSIVDERLDLAERILFQTPFEILILRRDINTWSGSSLA